MMSTPRWVLVVALLLLGPAATAQAQYKIKQTKAAPPKELKEPIAKLLADESIQVQDDKNSVLAEIWFCKVIPAKATADQIKNGLTYREVPETTLMGAVRFTDQYVDYRKQKIKPGVYTLRLAFQPMDGDHMGTAPFGEFCLLVPAELDKSPDLYQPKELVELSFKSTGSSHPGVMLLFPNSKPEDTPSLMKGENDHWILKVKLPASVNQQKAPLGVGLTVVGHSSGA